jgi:hypothetical protein
MSRLRAQRAVLASEIYWFGAPLGSPMVYDSGTSFSATPTLRELAESPECDDDSASTVGRRARYTSTQDGWDVIFDEA